MLDVLDTIREEIRDQLFVIMSNLDNLMVVSTLMLSIGFGFVVEGTFPPKKSQALGNWEIPLIGFGIDPLVVYSFLCAMSLVCPFWCLVFTIRMRYEVDLIVREHMKELKRQLCNVLQKKEMQAPPQESHCAMERGQRTPVQRGTSGLFLDRHLSMSRPLNSWWTKWLRRALVICPARRRNQVEDVANSMVNSIQQIVGPFTISDEIKTIDQAQIVKWAEKDLLQRMSNYRFYVKAAHLLLWAGMNFAILTCSILLGLYMMEAFPNTPKVWRTYSTITGVNGGVAILFAVWMWLFSDTSPVAAAAAINDSRGSTANLRPGRSDSAIFCRDEPFSPQVNRRATFRVRDASSGLDAYRQVAFPLEPSWRGGKSAPKADLAQLAVQICAKFKKPCSCTGPQQGLKYLVRRRDRLEIVDDEDVTQLADGDELEAFFGTVNS